MHDFHQEYMIEYKPEKCNRCKLAKPLKETPLAGKLCNECGRIYNASFVKARQCGKKWWQIYYRGRDE